MEVENAGEATSYLEKTYLMIIRVFPGWPAGPRNSNVEVKNFGSADHASFTQWIFYVSILNNSTATSAYFQNSLFVHAYVTIKKQKKNFFCHTQRAATCIQV